MNDRVTQDLNTHQFEQERAEEAQEAKTGSVSYLYDKKEHLKNLIKCAYRDPDKVYNAIGLAGLVYPDNVVGCGIAQGNFDHDFGLQLGAYLEDGNYLAFGVMLGEMAQKRIEQDAEDTVNGIS
jgi:hypothetical protein